MSEIKSRQIKPEDLKIGESVIGYLAQYFKNPKSQFNKDTENLVLVTPNKEKVTVWAAGDLVYMRERATQKGLDNGGLGVLVKITRIEKPATAKPKSRQKYFFNIAFKPSDTKDVNELGVTGGMRSSDPTEDEF